MDLTGSDDATLFAAVAAGDAPAVNACVARFGPLVWSLARRWCPDPSDAEDATQEIFFDLWRSAARFDASKASGHGFVAVIARRRLVDRARRRQRRPELVSWPEEFDVAAEGEAPGERALAALDAEGVLAQLTPPQRRMLELALLDGKTHEEIARETGTPIGTVKSHIRRGLERAKRLVGAQVGEGVA
ncbi:MAG: sigma-70 family RNA polymerase sigma factor [Gemmatimonadales bacterium]|nr:sigma-70 family RNA polymerase sigma factor [Gemmatimonadales bacterium]